MAITEITNNTGFTEWKDITNLIIQALGNNDSLSTTAKDSIVEAVNEVLTQLGDITSLTTSDKSSVVAAANELIIKVGTLTALTTTAKSSLVVALNEVNGLVGDLDSLNTTIKTSLVNSINEIKQGLDDGLQGASDARGDNSTLTTTEKGSLVGAVNELVTSVGDLTTLTTTEKSSLSGAVNELVTALTTANTRIDDEVGDLTALTTTEKGSAVGAINELDGDIGDKSTLTTTEKGSLVGSINEVNQNQVKREFIPAANLEINNGRLSTETTRVLTTFDETQTKCLLMHNSAIATEGDRFLDDNSDHGGAGGTLGTDIALLMTKIFTSGRTDNRNGYEFYVMDIAVGGGTAETELFNARNYYPVFMTDDSILGAIGQTITFQCWIRLKTLSDGLDLGAVIGDSTVTSYIDGVEVAEQSQLTTGDGWVHLRQTTVLTNEFKKFFPVVLANNGDVLQVALPTLFSADIDNGIHLGVI